MSPQTHHHAALRVFSAWGGIGDEFPNTVISGEGPPRSANGELLPDNEQFFWRIEVGSFEEALAIHHLRQGWEPHVPQGDAQPCPECNANHYPDGSGQCWRCQHSC